MNKALKIFVSLIVVLLFFIISISIMLKIFSHTNQKTIQSKIIKIEYVFFYDANNEKTIIEFENGKIKIFNGIYDNLIINKTYEIKYITDFTDLRRPCYITKIKCLN